MADGYFISIRVLPEGKSAEPLDVSDKVISLAYDDETTKADKLSLEISNADLSEFDNPVWRKGNFLEVSFGYSDNFVPPERFVIKKMSGGTVVTVEAHGKGQLMNLVQKRRTFDGMRRSEIARRIAEENGYGTAYQFIEDTKVKLSHVTQARMTDAQFLKNLAKREGFDFYVDASGFHFHRRKLDSKPVRTLTWYVDGTGDILDFNFENDVSARPGKITAEGFDPLSKQVIKAEADNASTKRSGLGGVIEIIDPRTGASTFQTRIASEEVKHATDADAASAKRAADGKYQNVQMHAVRLSMTVVGDPRLRAKRIVEVSGFGKRLSGNYFIHSAKHRLGGGYLVDLELRRDASGGYDEHNAQSAAKVNTQKGAKDGAKLNIVPREVVNERTGETRVIFVPEEQKQ